MTQRTYTTALAATGILSVFLHASFVFVVNHRSRKDRPAKNAESEPVRLRIIEHKAEHTTATPPTRTLPTKSQKTSPQKSSPREHAREVEPQLAEKDSDDEDERPYERLFPGPSWPQGTMNIPGGGSSGAERGPPPSTAAQRITNHLSGQLDIPLVYREKTSESRAVAKFRKKSDGQWYFEYIDGEPVLRAVLFEAFQRRENILKIDQLATELKRGDILFVLQQTTKPSLNGWEQFSDDIGYEQGGAKVIYARTIFTGSDGTSGITLPDKEAERAVMRDQVALKRLMNSPAYMSRIRDRLIGEKRP